MIISTVETGTVPPEVKQVPYTPAGQQDFAPWAPPEGASEAAALEHWFQVAHVGERTPRRTAAVINCTPPVPNRAPQ